MGDFFGFISSWALGTCIGFGCLIGPYIVFGGPKPYLLPLMDWEKTVLVLATVFTICPHCFSNLASICYMSGGCEL